MKRSLQDLFAQAGTVDTVNVVRDHGDRPRARLRVRRDGQRRGSADGDQPVERYELGGRALTVNEARPKTEGGFGGGGGYGAGGGNSRRRSEPRW